MKYSIRTKILFTCMLSGILPTLLIGAIAWNAANRSNDQTVIGFRSIAANIGNQIEGKLLDRYADAQSFGVNQAIHNREAWYASGDDNPIVAAMNNYVDAYNIYYLTLLVDMDGKLIATNTKNSNGVVIDTEKLYTNNYSSESWFRDAKEERFFESADGTLTGTVVEPLYVDSDVKKAYHDEGLALGFASPVRDSDGKIVAIWKNVVRFSLVEEVFETTYQELKERKLSSAVLTLLDEAGNVIVDFDPALQNSEQIVRDMQVIGKLNLVQKGVEAAQRVVRGETGAMSHSSGARERTEQCVGFAPLKGAFGLPGMKWSVLVRADANEVLQGTAWLKTTLLMFTILVVVVITGFSMFLANRLTRPIHASINTLVKMAKGDLTQRMPLGSGDEFEEMAGFFNSFAALIECSIKELALSASTLDGSSSELSSVSHELARGAAEATGQSSTVAAAAEEMSVNMTNIARSTDEVSDNVNSAASSVAQINTSIGEVAANAERAAAVANDAANLVQISNKKIEDLGAAANEIGKVIEVIQDIAEQTNLLALNATIEAARAGEAGKGFAVVATEVKELAKQTAAATDDIRHRIEGIQRSTSDAVSAIREISEVIRNVNQVSRTIAAAVEEQRLTTMQFSENVKQTAIAAETVARGVNESALASEEITQNISRVDQVLQRTAAGAAQSRTAGDNFLKLSEQMKVMVSKFTTSANDDSSLAV